MVDLQQISYMLRNATPRSLLLVDEFGKGTESSDGEGLFAAVVEQLAQRGARTLVATHFTSLFVNGMIEIDKLGIGLAHMDVHLEFKRDEADRVVCLYRLSPGISTTSHAAACARQYGIAQRVLDRAQQVSDAFAHCDITSLLDRVMTKKEEAALQDTEAVARRFIELNLDHPGDVRTALSSILTV